MVRNHVYKGPPFVYLGSFFLVPEGIKNISAGAILGFSKATGLP